LRDVELPQLVLIFVVSGEGFVVTRVRKVATSVYGANGVLALLLKVAAMASHIGAKTGNFRIIA
jgi:hypothetical protein